MAARHGVGVWHESRASPTGRVVNSTCTLFGEEGRQRLITTDTAEILRHDGLVIVRIKAGIVQSVADAEENLEAARAFAQGGRTGILVDIRLSPPLPPEVRHFYSGMRLGDGFAAMALLIEASPLGRMMGNIYLRVARIGVPTRLFTSESEAFAWLTNTY